MILGERENTDEFCASIKDKDCIIPNISDTTWGTREFWIKDNNNNFSFLNYGL